ncbi:hypothetical protein MD484_g8970, partial [Candolleomyces efflorescens]
MAKNSPAGSKAYDTFYIKEIHHQGTLPRDTLVDDVRKTAAHALLQMAASQSEESKMPTIDPEGWQASLIQHLELMERGLKDTKEELQGRLNTQGEELKTLSKSVHPLYLQILMDDARAKVLEALGEDSWYTFVKLNKGQLWDKVKKNKDLGVPYDVLRADLLSHWKPYCAPRGA